MQRTPDDGIVISCDFCGVDWDAYDEEQANPMTEGHHGSVICLNCVKRALEEAKPSDTDFKCTLGLTDHDAGEVCWRHPDPPDPDAPGLNKHAVAHWDNIRQAGRAFGKDPDIDYTWEAGRYPRVKG